MCNNCKKHGNRSNMAESDKTVKKGGLFVRQRKSRRITKRGKQNGRRFRRQKSRVRYYSYLRELRTKRKSDELCTAVSVFDITDLERAPMASSYQDLPPDVAQWQHQEQLNYWKSRAISLEYENRMLHQHIRNVYAKQIEERGGGSKVANKGAAAATKELGDLEDERHQETDPRCLPPDDRVNKRRAEEMKQLYGDKAPKITGMETAVQLNYELQTDQKKPPYWPHLPLKL